MAIAENKTRITITMGDGVLANLDEFCDQTGLSRSAAITSMVAEQLASKRQVMSVLENTLSADNLAKLIGAQAQEL